MSQKCICGSDQQCETLKHLFVTYIQPSLLLSPFSLQQYLLLILSFKLPVLPPNIPIFSLCCHLAPLHSLSSIPYKHTPGSRSSIKNSLSLQFSCSAEKCKRQRALTFQATKAFCILNSKCFQKSEACRWLLLCFAAGCSHVRARCRCCHLSHAHPYTHK